MTVPGELARILIGRPEIGVDEQAFPFLTVDEAGFPHVALLSRAEVDVSPGGDEILAVVASSRTRANLARDWHAGLIAIAGNTAHYAKLRVRRSLPTPAATGYALQLIEHKADTLGIPLSPVEFVPTNQIARLEDWAASERLLRRMASSLGQGT